MAIKYFSDYVNGDLRHNCKIFSDDFREIEIFLSSEFKKSIGETVRNLKIPIDKEEWVRANFSDINLEIIYKSYISDWRILKERCYMAFDPRIKYYIVKNPFLELSFRELLTQYGYLDDYENLLKLFIRECSSLDNKTFSPNASPETYFGYGDKLILLFFENKLVGFRTFLESSDSLSLGTAYITPNYRGIGLYKRLIRIALEHSKEVPRVDVGTFGREDNPMHNRLNSLGFRLNTITLRENC